MPSVAGAQNNGLPTLNQSHGHGSNHGHASQAQAHSHALQQQQAQKHHKYNQHNTTNGSVNSNTGGSLPPITGMGGSTASSNMTNGQLTKEVNKLLTKAGGTGQNSHGHSHGHSQQNVQKKRKKYRLNYGVQDSKPRGTSQVLKAYGLNK